MRHAETTTLIAVLLLGFIAAGCAEGGTGGPGVLPASESESSAKLSVYVVNYPLMYFAERIGGEHVEVVFPAPSVGDPAHWQPDATTVAKYQSADLIVRNGATYAKWMEMVTLPQSKVVDTSAAFADRLITIENAITHSHGPEGDHTHGETAFTTWLDPGLAALQAEAVAAAISAARPAAAGAIDANLVALRADLEALDRRIEGIAAGWGDMPLLASHPVYEYFARRYGLNLESVHFEPDQVPDERAWSELEALVARHRAQWMIWEAEPLPEVRDRLDAMGIGVVVFDPCATRPATGDFLSVMQDNVANLGGVSRD